MEFEVPCLGNDLCVADSCGKTGDADFGGGVGGTEDGIEELEDVSDIPGDGAGVIEVCDESLSTVPADKQLLSSG